MSISDMPIAWGEAWAARGVTNQSDASYVVEREDEEDGSIRYLVFDHRPETYRYVCSTNDDGGTNADAKRDAELIARGLNLLVQYGLERL
jgi:hypothetical protein